MGEQDIQIGNPKFDGAFVIQANDEPFARRLLTPEVQQKLLGLEGPLLSIKPKELFLRIFRIPKDTYGYDNLIDATVLLLGEMKSLRGKV
jgi:hypothetical protein